MTTTIAIVYTPRNRTPFDEHVSEAEIEAISTALSRHGLRPARITFDPASLEDELGLAAPSAILNLAYGWTTGDSGTGLSQPAVAERLEQFGVPVVGAPAAVQYVLQDKRETGDRVRRLGILAPRELDLNDRSALPPQAVLKPRFGACHRGVRLVDPRLLPSFDPANEVLQDYIEGRECTLAVLERDGRPHPLLPIFIDFRSEPAIMDWSRYRWDLTVGEDTDGRLRELAARLFTALGLRDYARFDLRLSAKGPVLLDANALPNLDPSISLLPAAAKVAGLSFDTLVTTLVDNALARLPDRTIARQQRLAVP